MSFKNSSKFQPNSHHQKKDPSQAIVETDSSKNNEISTQLLDSSFEEYDWLSSQFNRPASRAYQYWLAFSLIIALMAGTISIKKLYILYKEEREAKEIILVLGYIMTNIGSLLLFFGCGEMFFAVKVRRSAIAQKGFVKFQYSTIVSILGLLAILSSEGFQEYLTGSLDGLFIAIALAIIPASHIFAGNSVIKIFRKNHPLIRRDFSQNLEEPSLLEQNEVLAAEVLKYDLQLEKWPYLVFKYWLKVIAVFEIARLCFYVEFTIVGLIPSWSVGGHSRVKTVALLCFSSLISAYSCFLIEFAIGKKVLAKSKRAIILLMINIPVSIIAAFDLLNEIGLFDLPLELKDKVRLYGFWFAYCALIPVLSLAGAVQVHKVIKQRDGFAKFSTYTDDSYF